jgi:hypothetical protein
MVREVGAMVSWAECARGKQIGGPTQQNEPNAGFYSFLYSFPVLFSFYFEFQILNSNPYGKFGLRSNIKFEHSSMG